MGMVLTNPFRRTPAPEQKSLAAPTVDLLELFGVSPTVSGLSLSVEQALRVPAVSCAIRTIAEAAATLSVMVKEVTPDGTESDRPNHPISRLLRGDVNEWTSGPKLIADLVSDALISDVGGIAYVGRAGDSRVVEIVRYRRGAVTVKLDAETEEPTFELNTTPLNARNVLHLRPTLGRAPLTLARDAIGISAILERHAANLFARGARPSGALLFPRGMGEDAVKKARAAWRLTHEGGDAGGKTAILYDGATFEPFQLSSVDAQFLELRRFQLEEIARAFCIPAPLIGDLSRATWSNLESKHREFLSLTLEPWLLALEAAMRRALFLPDEREHFVIRFDRDDFGRADLSARATSINSLIASRVLSPNEGRSWLGLAPREGGDEFANPNINPERPTGADSREDFSG